MNKLTFQQADDLIMQAYFKDEIQPMRMQFCFCGTLSPDSNWNNHDRDRSLYPYTVVEYLAMEKALFMAFSNINYNIRELQHSNPALYEDLLFEGMCRAREVLKQIHISRGENVDFTPLGKRVLEGV